ncbi:hypothetical protein FA15DRAFT_668780 [Coprinopsis marcescibilis]|uniref:Uncharacterized protein n=1 Tax=Coprinopsis marcescibilis TaxID=230819 RepID=A0A5C3KXN6_COPMA|nr:hypothetical protein FA15DRAFT_668780 [Coprinopsis marcescibilis]
MVVLDPEPQSIMQTPSDSPPSYDYAVDSSNYPNDKPKPRIPTGINESEPLIPYNYSGPSCNTQPTFTPSPTVYYYTNPVTGERITSFLPPTHPEMICLQAGEHVPQTKYGILGILAAVFWFPLGIGLCLLDKHVRCSRCGLTIDDGICG